MRPPNEFWLCLHRLTQAYDAEGLSGDECAQNIVAQFTAMPPIAQRQVLAELAGLTTALSDLYPRIVVAGGHDERLPKMHRPRKDAG
jgi:hypothetical protein